MTAHLAFAHILFWLLLCTSPPVWAHASLSGSEPRDGAVVPESPREIVLIFNEQVEPAVLLLFDPAGGKTLITNFRVAGSRLILMPPQPLAQGTHALSWRVVSADAHPVGGTLLFSIGAPGGVGFTPEGVTDPAVRAAIWLARLALYLGFFIGIGGALYTGTIAAGSPPLPAARRVMLSCIALALMAVPVSVGLQGLDALARPLGELGSADVWRAGYATSYGTSASLALAALLAALASLFMPGRRSRSFCAAVALVMLGTSFCASGHVSTAEPFLVSVPALVVHVAALALWLGALVPLLIAIRSNQADAVVDRFSRTIRLPLAGLLIAGVVLAFIQLGRVDALWSTDYGRVLCLKLAAVVALLGLAAVNYFVLTPAWRDGDTTAPRRLSRTIAAELVIAVLILGVVGFWRFTPPPRALAAQANEPLFTHIHIGRAMADVTMTPQGRGRWRIDIVLQTGEFQPLAAQEVEIILTNSGVGIEPITRTATKSVDGNWQVDDIILPVPGIWGVDITALVSDFERVDLQGTFEIKR